MGPLACPGHPGPTAGFAPDSSESSAAKNSSAVFVLVCCSPETSRPLAARKALSSAVAWKASEGAALADSSRILDPSG